jgi:uncharacterized protein YcaQ
MTAITFDTHQFIKKLKASGMPEIQAEAISAAVRESNETAGLATKTDLREYESLVCAKVCRSWSSVSYSSWAA